MKKISDRTIRKVISRAFGVCDLVHGKIPDPLFGKKLTERQADCGLNANRFVEEVVGSSRLRRYILRAKQGKR